MQIPPDAGEQKILLRSLMNIRMPGEMDDAFLHVQDAYIIEERDCHSCRYGGGTA